MGKPQKPPGYEEDKVDLGKIDLSGRERKGGQPKKHLQIDAIEPGPYSSREELYSAIDSWLDVNDLREEAGFGPIPIAEFAAYAEEDPAEVRRVMTSPSFIKICNAKSKARVIHQARRLLPAAIEKLKFLKDEDGVKAAKEFLNTFMDFMRQQNWDAVKIEDVEEVSELEGPKIIRETLSMLEKMNGAPINPYIAIPRLVGVVIAETGGSAVGAQSVPQSVPEDEVATDDGPDPALDTTPETAPGTAGGGGSPGEDRPDGSVEPVREVRVPDDGLGPTG